MQAEGAILLVILIAAYFIPTIVAYSRGHRNASAITVLNLLLGWTLIGWVAALVWSLTSGCEACRAALVGRYRCGDDSHPGADCFHARCSLDLV